MPTSVALTCKRPERYAVTVMDESGNLFGHLYDDLPRHNSVSFHPLLGELLCQAEFCKL